MDDKRKKPKSKEVKNKIRSGSKSYHDCCAKVGCKKNSIVKQISKPNTLKSKIPKKTIEKIPKKTKEIKKTIKKPTPKPTPKPKPKPPPKPTPKPKQNISSPYKEIVENWNDGLRNTIVEQNYKKLGDGIQSQLENKKKFISIDALFAYDSKLANELIKNLPIEKVLDGYEDLIYYFDNEGVIDNTKGIAKTKLREFYQLDEDNRLKGSFLGNKISKTNAERIRRQFKEKFGGKD